MHSIFSRDKQAHPALVLAFAILLVTLIGSWSLLTASAAPVGAKTAYERFAIGNVTAENLRQGIRERSTLMLRSVVVRFITGTGTTVAEWNVSLADHPTWVTFSPDMGDTIRPVVQSDVIREYLQSNPIDGVPSPKACVIQSEHTDAQGVRRIETSCLGENGYTFDQHSLAGNLKEAFESKKPTVDVALTQVAPVITGMGGSGETVNGTMTLLASGQSNFKGSGAGRKDNVRKALNERINNIVIPQGATFSFNSALGEKVSLSAGWKMALTIFNGGELKPAPGGGICQASTTLYRAALRAGLPILAHKNHSLYVHYYEAYGVGLDATIFMGHQDMIFRNDTPGPIVIQAFNRGDEATVNIYGIDDGRSVTISGPFFARTGQTVLTSDGHQIRTNEIGWERSVQLPQGDALQEVILARYKTLPLSLSKKYMAETVQTRGGEDIAMRSVVAEHN